MKVLLVCERSGGHVFPALSVGKKLRKRGDDVCFFVTSGFLKSYIEKEGFRVVGRSFASRNLLFEGLWRFFEALILVLTLRPKKVIGFGGRDSFFLVLLSSLLPINTIIYEPNIKPGKANKVLSFFVDKVLWGFEIGIPMRENIRTIDKAAARKILNFDQRPIVFCLGGSQGSSFINQIFMKFVQSAENNFQIIHLTGREGYSDILKLYDNIAKNSFVKDFHYEVELLYSAADIVISRAGANTLGELAYYKLPSVLIPYPKAGAHQKENAFYFKEKGAAFVRLQDNFSFNDFSTLLKKLIEDNNLRESIKENLSGFKLGVSFEDFCNSVHF
ncbi:MAG: UDP-N-acetylglucosamine--N-acetylmuramyl-(pentapeptide) pyrophosphoryl-undecaprenol N-acetylglucosamine transferase [Candidatus Omnitrophota bacterium]